LDTGGGQGEFLAADALDLGHPSVGIELGRGENFVAGIFDGVFHLQPSDHSRCEWAALAKYK